MVSQEALLTVILVAVIVNLSLGCALLLVPRFRRAVTSRAAGARSGGDAADLVAPASGRGRRPGVGVFGPMLVAPAPTDPETGFDLPGAWSRWLEEEDARIRRYRRPATIVLVEIEGLERLAERLGPDTVARLAQPVAANLKQHARQTDRLARIAISRFGVLLAETDEIQAINYVERIRSACDTWLEAGGIASRLLIGWAEANGSRSVEAAVQSAEDRLNADRRQRPASVEVDDDDDLFDGVRASA